MSHQVFSVTLLQTARFARARGHEALVTALPMMIDFHLWLFIGTMGGLIVLYIVETLVVKGGAK